MRVIVFIWKKVGTYRFYQFFIFLYVFNQKMNEQMNEEINENLYRYELRTLRRCLLLFICWF